MTVAQRKTAAALAAIAENTSPKPGETRYDDPRYVYTRLQGGTNTTTLNVPEGYTYEILAVATEVTTNATVGSRCVFLQTQNYTGGLVGQAPIVIGRDVAASFVQQALFLPGLSAAGFTSVATTSLVEQGPLPLSPCVLPVNWTMRVSFVSADAADWCDVTIIYRIKRD